MLNVCGDTASGGRGVGAYEETVETKTSQGGGDGGGRGFVEGVGERRSVGDGDEGRFDPGHAEGNTADDGGRAAVTELRYEFGVLRGPWRGSPAFVPRDEHCGRSEKNDDGDDPEGTAHGDGGRRCLSRGGDVNAVASHGLFSAMPWGLMVRALPRTMVARSRGAVVP